MKIRVASPLVLVAVAVGVAAPTALGAVDAHLQGTFAMRARITFVDNVFGEHRGERLQRSWTFAPWCAAGVCRAVTLDRQRSGRHILDVVVLKHRGAGLYVGQGRFWVPLRCAGQVVAHGGLATETITVRITHTELVGTTRFATGVKATYRNPRRVNLTTCPGGIGSDAAKYSGLLASPLLGPPTASFNDTVDPGSTTATFADTSAPGRGGARIVSWLWNFGDTGSSTNTSTQQDPTHQYTSPGTYTVTLQVRDIYGQTALTTRQITI